MDKPNKDIELRSDEVQEVMGEISPAIVRWGITVIFFIIVILLAGCFIFKYPDTITATVTITTEEPPASIIARATGKIDQIYVKNNQDVKTGAALGVIQNPASTTDMLLLSQRIEKWNSLNQNLSDAKAVFDERSLQLGSVQASYASFLSLLREYADFKELKYYPQKITLQEHQVVNQRENLNEMQKQGKLMKQQLTTALSTFKRDSLLYKRGIVSEEDYDAAKNRILQSRQSYSSLLSSIKQAEIGITQCQGSMLDLQQEFKENENKYAISLQMATEQLTTEIKTWERNYLLVSPINGTVNLMGFWSDNQNVESGETIFTIQPSLQTSPIGKALMPVQGSGKVKVGQRANVRLNNFPDQEFGFLEGNVQNISATPNSDGMYVVEIRFPNGLTTNYHKKLPITRQMEGNVEIITEDIRLIERIFNPIKKLLKKHT
ncbi:MAG: HlyD family efflux transporter periplasmic adaptor subunit [Bacteroidales bacterium]|nr:HlyD family efflux transporter periplasmic adaptor subunit [Bacteroidales bacterium]